MLTEAINNVLVVGAGTMGHSIAQVFAEYKKNVLLADLNDKALKKALERIKANLTTLAESGAIHSEDIDKIIERIECTVDIKDATKHEINFVVEDKDKVLQALEEKYNDGKIIKIDGLTVEYPDWWFNVRASNTEPKIRLNLEARDKNTMTTKRDEVIKLIEQ